MKRILFAGALALAACATTGQIEAVAFCDSAEHAVERAAFLNANDMLSPAEVQSIDTAIAVIDPFCSRVTPGEAVPGTALDAMDRLLLIIATRGV